MPVVHVKQTSLTTTEGTARDHTVLVDRPEAKGGTDAGMMGGEMLLVALGGCFMSNLLEAVRTRDLGEQIKDIAIEIDGTLAQNPSRYESIAMNITANFADAAEFEKLVQISERSCIVANSLRGSVGLAFSIAPAGEPA